MVAQYADGCNLFGDAEQARHLLGVLQRHCEDAGRDPAEITKTSMMSIAIAETEDGVRAKLDAMRAAGLPEQRIAGTVGRHARADPRACTRVPRRGHRGRDVLHGGRPRSRGGHARRHDAGAAVRHCRRLRRVHAGPGGAAALHERRPRPDGGARDGRRGDARARRPDRPRRPAAHPSRAARRPVVVQDRRRADGRERRDDRHLGEGARRARRSTRRAGWSCRRSSGAASPARR